MKDKLVKALAYDGQVRVFVLTATQLVRQAQEIHDTWHTATAAFGRTLVGTLLLSANLKGEDRLSVEITGQGPIGRIYCEGDAHGHVRGLLSEAHVALDLNADGKLDVAGGVGLPGILTIRKYIEGGQPFAGQVELVSGEIAEDFTYYMAVSEQTPSAIGLSVFVNPDESVRAAGGFMLQVMPGATEETIEALEGHLASLGRFSTLIDQGESIEDLLAALVVDATYKVLAEEPLSYQCDCTKEDFLARLKTIGRDDLKTILAEDGEAELVCHYCGTHYLVSREELEALIKELEGEDAHV